ncbi:MAG TPA: hypothetical protein VGZ00_06660 [Candidatus Baltobacteraceae bacterium]|jgi:hypothetical protein|nr:hypothetical protein [Candidatus Baltobacteraceae bacterium]
MKKTREHPTVKILWFAVMLVLIAGYATIFQPAQARIAALRERERINFEHLQADRLFLNNRRAAQTLVKQIQTDLQATDLTERSPSPIGSFLIQLSHLASLDGVTIVEILPDAAAPLVNGPRTLFSGRTLSIHERGSFLATEHFLRDLSLMKSLIRIERVNLTHHAGAIHQDRNDLGAPVLDGTLAVTLEHTNFQIFPLISHESGS